MLISFFCVAQLVNANYYLYYGAKNSDVSQWNSSNRIAESTASGTSVTFTVDGSRFTKDTYYWLGVTQYSSYFIESTSNIGASFYNHMPITDKQINATGVSGGTTNVTVSGCSFHLAELSKTDNNVSEITISFSLIENGTHNCAGEQKDSYKIIVNGTVSAPTVTTQSSSAISNRGATLTGNIVSAGASDITENGVVVYTDDACTTPIANGNSGKITTPSPVQSGAYSVSVSGLESGTTYYFKAYAINGSGTSYGGKLSFTTSAETRTPPVVRWGYAPSIDNYDLVPSAYIASRGCATSGSATVGKLKLYVKIGADPTTSSYDKIYEFTGTFNVYTLYTKANGVYIPSSDEFLMGLTSNTDLHMGFIAENGNAINNTSAMSDIAKITYKACEGGIRNITITPAGPNLVTGSTTFTAAVNDDASTPVTYDWKVGGSSQQSSTSASYTMNVSAGFTLTLDASNEACGTMSKSIEYSICSNPITGQTVAVTRDDGGSMSADIPKSSKTFTANLTGSNNAESWEWFVDGVSIGKSTTPSRTSSQTIDFSTYETGDYVLTVIASGCPSTEITASYTLKVRNGMSPVVNPDPQTINACASNNGNRFAASVLFGETTPESITVIDDETSADVSSDFKCENGYIYLTNTEQESFSSRVFHVTAHKTGFSDAIADLTLTFQKVIPTGSIVIITPNGSTAEPWHELTIKATITDGVSDDRVLWSVSPTAGYISPETSDSNANVVFKAPGRAAGSGNRTYTVMARIQSSTCGTSEGVTQKIEVTPDNDEYCGD